MPVCGIQIKEDMSEKRKSFKLYTDYKQHIGLLSDEDKGRLFQAVLDYADGIEVELEGMPLIAFSFIKEQMDKDSGKCKTSNPEESQKASELFEYLWKLYPRQQGKGSVSAKKKVELLKVGREQMERCIERFKEAHKDTEPQFIPYGSTFFNSGYIDYLDDNYGYQQEEMVFEEPEEPEEPEMTDDEWLEMMKKTYGGS